MHGGIAVAVTDRNGYAPQVAKMGRRPRAVLAIPHLIEPVLATPRVSPSDVCALSVTTTVLAAVADTCYARRGDIPSSYSAATTMS